MKIVVFMKNWIGDVVFQIPFLEALRHNYPSAKITCIAPARCHEVLKHASAVDEILLFDEKDSHRSLFSKMKFASDLKKQGPWEMGFLLHRSRTRAFLLLLAGVKKRIGYGKRRSLFLTTSCAEPREKLHHVDYHLSMARLAGLTTVEDSRYSLVLDTETRKEAGEVLEKEGVPESTSFCCFHLGANWLPKRWPRTFFLRLGEMLLEKKALSIVVTGGVGDIALAKEMAQALNSPRAVSIAGKTNLGVLAGVFERSAFTVSSDSGPMHIASAVGCPVFALFGPTDPELTGPMGTGPRTVLSYVPEGYQVPYFGKEFPPDGWIENITPEKVFETIEGFLEYGKTGRVCL